MNTDYFFNSILKFVSDTTGVSDEDIISTSRKMSIVDARSMVVYYASKLGLPHDYISERLHRKSHNSIPNLLDIYYKRIKSNYFHYLSTQVGRHVENIMSSDSQ